MPKPSAGETSPPSTNTTVRREAGAHQNQPLTLMPRTVKVRNCRRGAGRGLPVSDAFNASYEVLAGGVECAAILGFGFGIDGVECLEQFFSFLGLDERVACAVESVKRLPEPPAQLGEP
jgi:hypothetical protein